jgi:hypothetical protein
MIILEYKEVLYKTDNRAHCFVAGKEFDSAISEPFIRPIFRVVGWDLARTLVTADPLPLVITFSVCMASSVQWQSSRLDVAAKP